MSATTRLAHAARHAWHLYRQATGEARWDEYVAGCKRAGVAPVSRRAFERNRADAREHSPQSRCC